MNRRLVPMPARHRSRRKAVAAPTATIAPSNLKSWHYFPFLIVTALIYYFVGKLILFIVGIVLLVRGWVWLTFRFPLTMSFINFFIAALLSGGRRRR